MKKFLSLILSVATVFLLCGCTDTYRFFSNDVNNYEVYSVVLESGQKKEFDIYEIFKNCGCTMFAPAAPKNRPALQTVFVNPGRPVRSMRCTVHGSFLPLPMWQR